MTDSTRPPRPSLRPSVYNYLSSAVWNQQQSRLETANGDPVFAWLNQTGTPTQTAVVQWEAGTSNDLAEAVGASVPYNAWDIIKNGQLDSQTGLVSYSGKDYRFIFETVSGAPRMRAIED